MKNLGYALLLSLGLASAALAQESTYSFVREESLPRSLAESESSALAELPELPAVRPEDWSWVLPQMAPPQSSGGGFSIGPAGGYMKAKGADNGVWYGGAQARLHFLRLLAVEASVMFHETEYNGGDTKVIQYPVQLSAMLFPLPDAMISPYILGGVGWYYTTVDNSGALAAFGNDTSNIFGEHFGGGVDLKLSPQVSFDVDFRYIFQNPSNETVSKGDFNYWTITFALNFSF